jgi:hypothetical protein
MTYGLDDGGSIPGSGTCLFLFATASRPALGAYSASYPMGTMGLFTGVERPGRRPDHSFPSSAEVKNAWSYTSTPQYVFMYWLLIKHKIRFRAWYLVKRRDIFAFYIYSWRIELVMTERTTLMGQSICCLSWHPKEPG